MLLTVLVCLISALASGSDGTGVLGERVCKDVKPFSALNISNCCNVVYEQGDEYKVRVVAEKALLDSIADIADCKVVGGMLVVSVMPGFYPRWRGWTSNMARCLSTECRMYVLGKRLQYM